MPGPAALLKKMLVGAIRLYQVGVSPLLPASCRYDPSCSEYARQAIERFGAGRGSWLAVRRLLRCHPFGGFGPDPVPERTGDGGPARPSGDSQKPRSTEE